MKQVFTQKCLRVFALMVLMLASSMVANAKYYLRGDYTSDGSGWSSGIEFIYRYDMRHMYDYIDLTVHEGFQFKIFCDDEVYGSSGRYFGCSDGNNTVNSVPWISGSLTNDLYDDGENIVFAVAGTYRIIYHTHNSTVQIINIPCPVEEVTGLVGGRVDVNDTEGWAGRPMDVDVTPIMAIMPPVPMSILS